MYLWVIYFSLIGVLISIFYGRKLGQQGVCYLLTFCMSCSLISAYWTLIDMVYIDAVVIDYDFYTWSNVEIFRGYFGFFIDILAIIMMVVVTTVAWCVNIYSLEYMSHDPHLPRFLIKIHIFTFFMLILVTSANIVQFFFAWEGVGICSYLLVNFWYTRILANKAAMKALIINKIGDIFYLYGMILLFCYSSIIGFVEINCSAWFLKHYLFISNYFIWIGLDYYSLILFCFVIGACAKSAQIGLHTWLPDAMEGPTPVSALIHAATMVTAGVFLLLRFAQLLKYDENILMLISFLGGITAFIAATIGLFQNDIKKIIAYSTCSQLGYMVLSCGLNNYSGSLFHLVNHAFFKALLFLSAGAIIHSMLDQQDIRRMGMLLKYLPISYIMMLIGSLTIMGIPFLTGFYSKDFILEYVYSSNTYLCIFLYWLGVITALITSFYSIKILFLTFYNIHNSHFNNIYNKKRKKIIIVESKIFIIIALMVLFLGSIFVGFIFKEFFIGMGTDIWSNTLDTESYKDTLKIFEVEFLPMRVKIIPIIFTILGGVLSFLFLNFYVIIIEFFYKIYYYINILFSLENKNKKNFKTYISFIIFFKKFIYNGYYFNEIYNYFLFKNKKLSYNLFKDLDKGIIEYFSYLFIVKNINQILYIFSKKNKNRLDYIVFTMFLGIFIIIIVLLFLDLVIDLKILGMLLLLIILEIMYTKNK